MIRRISFLIMALFVLSLPVPVLAAEPAGGIIEGQIINGTEGGSSVAGHDIVLTTYLNGAEASTAIATSDDEGRFVFGELSTQSEYVYAILVVFQQAEYYSEWVSFEEEEMNRSIEMTVYDSTTSDEAIKVTTAHTIIYVGSGSLQVQEYFLFTNESDRTYIGSKEIAADGSRETLRFYLPGEVTELQLEFGLMECCIHSMEDGFVETMPLLPGNKEVLYSYNVAYNSGTYTLPIRLPFPTTALDLLIQGEGIAVTSDQLTIEDPLDMDGTSYSYLSGNDLTADDTLTVRLSGLPRTNSRTTVLWVSLTLVALGTAAGFLYLTRKRKLQPVSPKDGPERVRRRLLVELAQLDDAFETGKMPEGTYHKLREERKAQLVEALQKSNKESDRT